MIDEGMELIQKRVQQAIGLIERLKEEANALREEREVIKGKIDTAVSMLDNVQLDDMLESIAEEVVEETGTTGEDDSGEE
jgi:hypothetical protein